MKIKSSAFRAAAIVGLALALFVRPNGAQDTPGGINPPAIVPITQSYRELLDKAVALAASGQWREGIDACTAAISLEPKNPEAYFRRGSLRYAYDDGSSADALADFNACLKYDPKGTFNRTLLFSGAILSTFGFANEAIRDLTGFLELSSDSCVPAGRKSRGLDREDVRWAHRELGRAYLALADSGMDRPYNDIAHAHFIMAEPEATEDVMAWANAVEIQRIQIRDGGLDLTNAVAELRLDAAVEKNAANAIVLAEVQFYAGDYNAARRSLESATTRPGRAFLERFRTLRLACALSLVDRQFEKAYAYWERLLPFSRSAGGQQVACLLWPVAHYRNSDAQDISPADLVRAGHHQYGYAIEGVPDAPLKSASRGNEVVLDASYDVFEAAAQVFAGRATEEAMEDWLKNIGTVRDNCIGKYYLGVFTLTHGQDDDLARCRFEESVATQYVSCFEYHLAVAALR